MEQAAAIRSVLPMTVHWQTAGVEPDIEGMLRRVVHDVLDDGVDVAFDAEPNAPHVRRATLGYGTGPNRRTAGLSASDTGWFDVTIFELGVSATLFEYDDATYMEAILRELALVALAYLRGEGRVEQKRGLLRSRPMLVITVDGKEWILGRRTSKVHYPDDNSTTGEDPG
jgi:hypothetical protein